MRYNIMSLDWCLKQLHVVHIKVFHRMQYIRLLLLRHFPVRHFPFLQIPVTHTKAYIRVIGEKMI